ncbi:MAG: hypothetical protein QXS74_09670 [Nitrososphaeria archaeon]
MSSLEKVIMELKEELNKKAELKEGRWMDLAIMGIGAGFKGWLEGQLNKYFPALGEWSGLVGGLLISYFGDRIHPYVTLFGKGVLIAAIGQLVARYTGGGLPTSTKTTISGVESLAYQYAGGG